MSAFWAGAGGSILDNAFGAMFGNKAWNNTKDFTREQMAWQEQMSNTAYQRAAKDLESAGLNRVLALGNSATTPGAGGAAQVPFKPDLIGKQLQYQQIANAKAAEELTSAEADKVGAEAAIKKWQAKKYLAVEPYVDEALKQITSGNPWKLIEMMFMGGISTAKDAKDTFDNVSEGAGDIASKIREKAMHTVREWENYKSKSKRQGDISTDILNR